ncbi:MAG TPA: sigma-70 family RNA polymerase sigma factor [Candidatus Polarisedimenticolaceae bacterium]
MESPTDEDLVLALRAGNLDSLGALVARWEQPLFRFVLRLVGRDDEARDVCQETFLRVLDRARHYRPGAKFSTWMYQIALNLCRDRARRNRRWDRILVHPRPAADDPAPEPAAVAPEDEQPEAALEAEERRAAVRRVLESLPTEQREVVVLKEYEGLKFREIAEVLGLPESTVKSRMYFALESMRGALERQGVRV